MENNSKLLRVNDLKTWFPIRKGLMRRTIGYVKAVDGVSFAIEKGNTLGLVGESGCGKTTVAKSIMRLTPSTSGQVHFENTNVLSARGIQLSQIRKDISLVFQDPFGSLNPRMTIGNIVGEPMQVQRKIAGNELSERVADLLTKVGLSADYMNRYPHEFSGGQRQRIGLARALAVEPKLIICDEPVSALDISIQSQILNLLKDLQDEFGLTYLFIAHDLAVVEFFCDIVAVMYMGKIVEKTTAEQLYQKPLHPYTHTLMSAIPRVDTSLRGAATKLKGEVSSCQNQQGGCPFYSRCSSANSKCLEKMPPLEPKNGNSEPFVACWKC